MAWIVEMPLPLSWLLLSLAIVMLLAAGILARARRIRRQTDSNAIRAAVRVDSGRTTPPEPTVTYAEIKASYDGARARWMEWDGAVRKRIELLESRSYERMSPSKFLENASSDERGNLAAILGISPSSTPSNLVEALRKAGSHTLASMVRGGHVPYEAVVVDAAVKLGAPRPLSGAAAADVEHAAIGAAFKQMLANATPQQREAMLAALARSQMNAVKGTGVVAGGLAIAHLSGFGLYMAASSTLAAITGAVGATLPFAVYTGMSSVLATITGPVGWAALATWAVAKLDSPAYKKTVPAVLAIAAVRARLTAERDQEMESLVADRDGPLHQESRRLARMCDFLEKMRASGAMRRVPKISVPW